MNTLTEMFSQGWIHATGWTLLHSLWQALLVFLLAKAVLRSIPETHSRTRYAAVCGAFVVFIAVAFATFVQALPGVPARAQHPAANLYSARMIVYHPDPEPSPGLAEIGSLLDGYMPVFVGCWFIGFLLFAARFAAGTIYSQRIRSSAVPVTNEWISFVLNAARRLGIKRSVAIAESKIITSPVVVGYLKPMILLPLGMMSGLTTDQVETIFIHELAHIKRHDYLVNLIQSFFEAVFFFNPFVRRLSQDIRREREHCCDDVVVSLHGNRHAYAHALALLAEARLKSNGFALALGDDRNILLRRIRRMMEKTSERSPASFAIPALLLASALFCISWLGIDQDKTTERESLAHRDTIPADGRGEAWYSRESIITYDENGEKHEKVVEKFEGDKRLLSGLPPLPPGFPLAQGPDTIPPGRRNFDHDWAELSRSLEHQLRAQLEHMEDLRFEMDTLLRHSHDFQQEFLWSDLDSLAIPYHAQKAIEELSRSEHFRELNEQLQRLHELQAERFYDLEHFRERSIGGPSYEKALRQSLEEDGYLSAGEPIESLEWSDDTFRVNGKSIKKADLEKYRELNKGFFDHPNRGAKTD